MVEIKSLSLKKQLYPVHLRLALRLKKIHKVTGFDQSKWLKILLSLALKKEKNQKRVRVETKKHFSNE